MNKLKIHQIQRRRAGQIRIKLRVKWWNLKMNKRIRKKDASAKCSVTSAVYVAVGLIL